MMSKDSGSTSEAKSLRGTPNGPSLLLRRKAIESRLQGGKITVHGSPQVQLPISCYGTMDSSCHYDKMVKQKELIEINTQLLHKKQEFTSKMSDISKKKVASKQKWDKIKERFESFVPYIDEDRAKKIETLQKYKLELLELNKKERELQKLKMELQTAIDRNTALQNKVKKYQMYADFLTIVGEKHLSWRDIDGALSPCKAVIKRHQSLVSTRDDILDNISTATAELGKRQKDIEVLQNYEVEHKLQQKAMQLEKKLDYLTSRNAAIQDNFFRQKQAFNIKLAQLNTILRAIDNLAWLCCKQKAARKEMPNTVDAKLRMIQHGIISKQDIINSIKHGSPGSSL